MTIRNILNKLKEVLEANGFERQVFEYGYEHLGSAESAVIIIIRLMGMEAQEISQYGVTRQQLWAVNVTPYVPLIGFSYTDSHIQLTEAVDSIISILYEYPYLGTGDSAANIVTELRGIGDVEIIETGEGEVGWMSVPMQYQVSEDVVVTEAE